MAPFLLYQTWGGGGISRKTYLSKVKGLPPINLWEKDDTGHTAQSKKEILAIFGGKTAFDTPKPSRLVEFILRIAGNKDTLILDSFAGSGTTAHAVLNMNKADGGHRKFILVEMADYAESITAERVKRVIRGYGKGNKAVEGTGGDFTFYELGEPLLLPDGNLNENVGIEKIRAYIFYTETREPLPEQKAGANPYFIGESRNTAYYFYYKEGETTVLNHAFLTTIKEKAERYLIYADSCALSQKDLDQSHITFKKIPRDIAKL